MTIAWSQSNYELSTNKYNERNNEIIIKGNVTEMEMDDGDRIIYINDKAVKIGEYTTHGNSQQEDWENEKEVYNKIDKYDYVEIYESDRIMCNGRTVYEGEPKTTLIQYYIGFGILTGFLSVLFTVIIFFSLRWVYDEYIEGITIRKKKHKKQDKIDALESKIKKLEGEKNIEKVKQIAKSIILCSKCNSKNQNDAIFCSICGNRLIDQNIPKKDDYYWEHKNTKDTKNDPYYWRTNQERYENGNQPGGYTHDIQSEAVYGIPHNLPAWKIPNINKPRNFCPKCVNYSLMHHSNKHYKCINCGRKYSKKQ